jgi:hypothetical protein
MREGTTTAQKDSKFQKGKAQYSNTKDGLMVKS